MNFKDMDKSNYVLQILKQNEITKSTKRSRNCYKMHSFELWNLKHANHAVPKENLCQNNEVIEFVANKTNPEYYKKNRKHPEYLLMNAN